MWRDTSGRLGVARAWCPQLGAHLGHVGRVKGDVLECRFHGFCFDAAGQCRATGYGGRVPSRARLSSFAVSEVAGAVLAWFPPGSPSTGQPSPDNGLPAPAWDLSAPGNDGWTAVKWKASTFAGHPLETTENSVDVGHLSFLHGYHDVVACSAFRPNWGPCRPRRPCSVTCRPASWLARSGPSPCPTSMPMCAKTAAYGPPSATYPAHCWPTGTVLSGCTGAGRPSS